MFHDGDLQSGISLAVQQSKAVLCFVCDDTTTSQSWEDALRDSAIQVQITQECIALRLQAGSQEAGFLGGICPIDATPAVIVIKNARVELNLHANEIGSEGLRTRLKAKFGLNHEASREERENVSQQVSASHEEIEDRGQETVPEVSQGQSVDSPTSLGYIDLPSAAGRMRLPNNAYEALQTRTQELLDQNKIAAEVLEAQLDLLERIPIFKEIAQEIRSKQHPPSLPNDVTERLLRMPGVVFRMPKTKPASNTNVETDASPSTTTAAQHQPAPVPVSATGRVYPPTSQAARAKPTPTTTEAPTTQLTPEQEAQRADYIKLQRSREQAQHDERERIKAQIKADREERRRREELRKQGFSTTAPSSEPAENPGKSQSSEVRLQVRTFDGSTLRHNFALTANITNEIRPWVDSTANNNIPYTLKLILTPLPNRNIEAAEEEQNLFDLGIRGSCTMVMVPVKGFVESYTGSTPGGMVGSAVSGGYNLVTGAAGALFGGVRSILGYGSEQGQGQQQTGAAEPSGSASTGQSKLRVRTLADQRAEEAKRDHQFYNGNQLNFQPRADEDSKED